jgi:hypothetical protein
MQEEIFHQLVDGYYVTLQRLARSLSCGMALRASTTKSGRSVEFSQPEACG